MNRYQSINAAVIFLENIMLSNMMLSYWIFPQELTKKAEVYFIIIIIINGTTAQSGPWPS
jgi:hypothetical protein